MLMLNSPDYEVSAFISNPRYKSQTKSTIQGPKGLRKYDSVPEPIRGRMNSGSMVEIAALVLRIRVGGGGS